MALRESTWSVANGGRASSAPTCAERAGGVESQSSSGIEVGRSLAPSAAASEDSSATTKLSPTSSVVGNRRATATSRAATTSAPKTSWSSPSGPAARAMSGLAITGSTP